MLSLAFDLYQNMKKTVFVNNKRQNTYFIDFLLFY